MAEKSFGYLYCGAPKIFDLPFPTPKRFWMATGLRDPRPVVIFLSSINSTRLHIGNQITVIR